MTKSRFKDKPWTRKVIGALGLSDIVSEVSNDPDDNKSEVQNIAHEAEKSEMFKSDNDDEIELEENKKLFDTSVDAKTQTTIYHSAKDQEGSVEKDKVKETKSLGPLKSLFVLPSQMSDVSSKSSKEMEDDSSNSTLTTQSKHKLIGRDKWKIDSAIDKYNESADNDLDEKVKRQIEEIKQVIDKKAKDIEDGCIITIMTLSELIKMYKQLLADKKERVKKVIGKSKCKNKANVMQQMARNRSNLRRIDRLIEITAEINEQINEEGIKVIYEQLHEIKTISKTLSGIKDKVVIKSYGVSFANVIKSKEKCNKLFADKIKDHEKEIMDNLILGLLSVNISKDKELTLTTNLVDDVPIITMVENIMPTIKVNDSTYKTSLHIDHSTMKIFSTEKIKNHVLKTLVKNTRLVIFDIPNMNKHMGISHENIDRLARVFNNVGITTMSVEDDLTNITKSISMNVVIDGNEHDDLVTLMYSYVYNGVIITNDMHTEFKDFISVCVTHREVIMRKNECCSKQDEHCNIRYINLNRPRYMSLSECIHKGQCLTAKFDLPLIRYKGVKKRGSTRLRYDDELLTDEARYVHRKSQRFNNAWVTELTSAIPKLNINLINFEIDNIQTSVVDMGNYTTIAHIIDVITMEQINRIKAMCKSKVSVDEKGYIVIRYASEKQEIANMVDPVMEMRNRMNQTFVSHIFNTNDVMTVTQRPKDLLTAVEVYNGKASVFGKIITSKKMIEVGLCVIDSSKGKHFSLIDDAFTKQLEDEIVDDSLKRSRDLGMLIKHTVLPRVDISKYIERFMTTKEELDELETKSEIYGNMIKLETGPVMTKQVPFMSDEFTALIESLMNIPIIMSEPTICLRQTKNKRCIDYDSATSKSYYDYCISVVRTWDYSEEEDYDEYDVKDFTRDSFDIVHYHYDKEKNDWIPTKAMEEKKKYKRIDLWRPDDYLIPGVEPYHGMSRVIIDSTTSDESMQCVGINQSDAYTLMQSFKDHGVKIINKILTDIMTILTTFLEGKAPLCLPPFIWAYKDLSIEMIDKSKKLMAEIKVKKSGYNVDCWAICTTETIMVIAMRPKYDLLYSTLALMHSNDFDVVPKHHYETKLEIDLQFTKLQHARFIQEHKDMYRANFNVFSLPMRLIGISPYETMMKYEPVIVGNIVQMFTSSNDLSKAKVRTLELDMCCFIMNDDSQGRFEPCVLLRENENGKIPIYREIHDMINTMKLLYDNGYVDIFDKYLAMLRPIYKWSDLIKHLKDCYKLELDDDEKWLGLLSKVKSQSFIPTNTCMCMDHTTDLVVRDFSSAKVRRYGTSISTNQAVFELDEGPNIVNATRIKTYNQEWITREMPMRGSYIVLKIKRGRKDGKYNRYDIITRLLKIRKDIRITQFNEQVDKNTNLSQLVSKYINRAINMRKSIIIINTDTIGSMLKDTTDKIVVKSKDRIMIYVPDTIMYKAIRSKIEVDKGNLIEQVEIDDDHDQVQVETNKNDTKIKRIAGLTVSKDEQLVIIATLIVVMLILIMYLVLYTNVSLLVTFPYKLITGLSNMLIHEMKNILIMQLATSYNGIVVPEVVINIAIKTIPVLSLVISLLLNGGYLYTLYKCGSFIYKKYVGK